jgi:alanine racemase
MRECSLTIQRSALLNNVAVLRQAMPKSRLLAMVKADAYGHGVSKLADWLAPVVDGFGVAFLQEALALREQGVRAPIAVMEGVFTADELMQAAQAELQLVVHSPEQVDLFAKADPQGSAVMIWLKVNTGMNRLGLRPADALRAYQRLNPLAGVSCIGLMTHFAAADELDSMLTDTQVSRFRALHDALNREQGSALSDSLANSAAILAWPEATGEWMRPGIALYGSSPFPEQSAQFFGLQPVMTMRSRIIAIQSVTAGETVGYGATWTATQASQIAVVAVGYGDGYPRHARTGTPVLINGERCALVGRVSMDMITVDLGETHAQVGDEVVLWGEGLDIDEVARFAGTISYELCCRLTNRPKRIYVD